MNNQYRVLVGPYRIARRYAQSMGWSPDEFVIVTRAHQLNGLDPARIARIITLKVHALGKRIVDEIHEEINSLKALWPVPVVAAA